MVNLLHVGQRFNHNLQPSDSHRTGTVCKVVGKDWAIIHIEKEGFKIVNVMKDGNIWYHRALLFKGGPLMMDIKDDGSVTGELCDFTFVIGDTVDQVLMWIRTNLDAGYEPMMNPYPLDGESLKIKVGPPIDIRSQRS